MPRVWVAVPATTMLCASIISHDAAGTVRGRRGHRTHSDLMGRDHLQSAEQHVRRCVRSGGRDAEPSEICAEERIEHAGVRERDAENCVRSGVARDVAERHHRGDREQRRRDAPEGSGVRARHLRRRATHEDSGDDRRQRDSGSAGAQPVEREYGGLWLRRGHHRWRAQHHLVEAVNRKFPDRDRIEPRLHLRRSPGKHDHAEQRPRHERAQHRGARNVGVARGDAFGAGRMPHAQKKRRRAHRDERGTHIHEPGPVEGGK